MPVTRDLRFDVVGKMIEMDSPHLEQAMMQISVYDSINRKRRFKKYVFLWKEKGLCLHQDGKLWIISHYQSGKRVLSNLLSRSEAIAYMMELDKIVDDWLFTQEELTESGVSEELGRKVKDLQCKIWRARGIIT